jgi:hypothetical protein
MALMDKMMESFIGRMSLEKKQEMMLKMMPMMMKDVNMAETMLKMVPEMLDNISLLDIFNVLKKVFPHLLKGIESVAELIARWDELLPKMMKKMPALMEKMMPIMEVVMPMMMDKMLAVMMTDEHKNNFEEMPKRMMPKMMANENLQKQMPEMMSMVIPHCLREMLPYMEASKKEEFVATMNKIIIDGNKTKLKKGES